MSEMIGFVIGLVVGCYIWRGTIRRYWRTATFADRREARDAREARLRGLR